MDLAGKGDSGPNAVYSAAGVIHPISGKVHARMTTVLGEDAYSQGFLNPASAGLWSAFRHAPGGSDVESMVWIGTSTAGFVPQNYVCV